ncbi:glycosyltransferase family 4 protein [Phocaeicola sp.]
MKIIYLYTSLTTVGGADRIVVQKANYLADTMGYEVYIITDSQKNRPIFFPLSPNVKHIDVDINFEQQYAHGLFIRSYYYFTLMYKYKKRIVKLLETIKPDIVITTLGRELDFLTRLKDGSIKIGESHIAKTFCRNFHLTEQRGFIYKQIAKYWRAKQEKDVKRLDALVVLTQRDADSWKNVKEAYIIPNSLPFYPQESSSCKEKKIISVGRFTEQKGYERFIEAWAKVNLKHPDWEVSVYGEGVDQNMLESLIKKNAIENNFKLCRPVKNIQDKYMESSIYVMTSRFEGFGMVLAEAMACGVPCISFDCPHGPADIIKNGEDGILVENGAIDQLADAICQLIENEEQRISMGNKAKINIKRYSNEVIMKKWDELFKNLKNTRL